MPDRRSPDWPAVLELGIAERALPGERHSGDRAVLAAYEGGALVAAIDGLGHGDEAAAAAAIAANILYEHAHEDPEQLLGRCHRALNRSRGAVMTLAWFDLEEESLSWTGVGNVEGRLVHARSGPHAPTHGAFTKGGVVGYNMPSVRVTGTDLEEGDVMVLATDGIDSGFARAITEGGPAQEIADRILAAHAKEFDDALVVVVRYRPAG